MKSTVLTICMLACILIFSNVEAQAQKGKKHRSYIQVDPPQQVIDAIEEIKPQLIIASGFEDRVYTEYWYSKGTYFVSMRWVARFIDDAWGGFEFPGEATIEITGGGKIKRADINYPIGL